MSPGPLVVRRLDASGSQALAAAWPTAGDVHQHHLRAQQRGESVYLVAEHLVRERGHAMVGLGVSDDNLEAYELYAQLAYVRTGVFDVSTCSYVSDDGGERVATENDEALVKELPGPVGCP